jgi:pteridine reductase
MANKRKVALVTGAARRVGKGIALALAARGYDLVVHYGRSRAEALRTVREIRRQGVEAASISADLSNASAVVTLLRKTLARYGRLDVFVNNAATFRATPWEELVRSPRRLEAEFHRSLEVNLKGPYLLAALAGEEMRRRGTDGHIINIGDWAQVSERPYRGYLPYHLSKAGLVALTQALANELAPLVRVNMVANGPVEPPPEFDAAECARVAAATPLRRWGGAQSVAEVVLGLLGSSFVTGEIIRNDGGRHLYPS